MIVIDKKDVLDDNIQLHTQLSDDYKKTEPHYRPENVRRVEKILSKLAGASRDSSLIDVGCGQGFIIDIAHNYFKSITGIDITPAMIDKIKVENYKCDLQLMICEVENMPFPEGTYDVCTAYAVLHHLSNLKPVFSEIYRVLKKGGVFYSDTDPNYYFWKAFSNLPDLNSFNEIVNREINAIKYKDQEIEDTFNIPKEIMRNAEILKHVHGGFKGADIKTMLQEIGFSNVEIRYEWFLGEAKIIHSGYADAVVDIMREHLYNMMPLSRHLFKYISIFAVK